LINALKYATYVQKLIRGQTMKYQVGETGRVVVARFEDGDEIIQGLMDIAKTEDIRAAVFYLVGGIKEAKIVVGPEKDELPPTPVWKTLNESHESAGVGTIFWYGNEPRIHFHGMYGKHESVKTGCLRELAKTFIIMEAVIVEIKGIDAVRDLDSASQMVLLKMID
jgi:predicted DNA-binding protein with PD1-like motif